MSLAFAAIYVLAVWYATTQALLWMVRGMPKPALNAVALVLAVVSSVLAVMSAQEPSVHAAYVGFTAGIGLWAVFEICFLTGAILGVDTPATSDRIGPRAWAALKAIVWHEAGLVATLIVLVVATGGTPNPTAAATFGALWVMRASAKINLFLGVRNLCTEFLPTGVQHLSQHFRKRDMNPFFPFTVACATIAAAFLLRSGLDPATSPDQATAAILIATLVSLGVAEHWLMLTPLSALDLWSAGRRDGKGAMQSRPVGAIRTFG